MRDRLREIIFRDYSAFSGKALENYFTAKLSESGRYTQIGNWWDRKGENEIAIIAADDVGRTMEFYEVKRDGSGYDENKLRRKAEAFLTSAGQYSGYAQAFFGLSLADMQTVLPPSPSSPVRISGSGAPKPGRMRQKPS
ncbi:MAG: hypothetical protein IJ783_00975 [Kiritimatiellae bacterium]|nr:hypothetical protein [Kiritimatiellia bacterium]